MAEQKMNTRRLGVADQQVLAKAVSLFSKPGVGDRAVSSHVIFTGKTARFSDGFSGLEIPFTSISGCALPIGPAAEVVFRGEAEITVTQTEDRIKVLSGGFSANLRFVDPESLQSWPAPSKGTLQSAPLSVETWAQASSIAFAADAGTRSEIAGVLLHKTMAFTTDGIRVARVRLPGDGVKDLVGLLPLKLITLVDGYSSQVQPSTVAFGENRAWVRFADGSVAWSLLPAADYPLTLLPMVAQRSQEAGRTIHARWDEQADVLGKAVERVVVFSADFGVEVTAEGSVLQVRGESPRGEATERVKIEDGACLDGVLINGLLFADACRRSQGVTTSPKKDCLFFRCPGFELLVMCLAR